MPPYPQDASIDPRLVETNNENNLVRESIELPPPAATEHNHFPNAHAFTSHAGASHTSPFNEDVIPHDGRSGFFYGDEWFPGIDEPNWTGTWNGHAALDPSKLFHAPSDATHPEQPYGAFKNNIHIDEFIRLSRYNTPVNDAEFTYLNAYQGASASGTNIRPTQPDPSDSSPTMRTEQQSYGVAQPASWRHTTGILHPAHSPQPSRMAFPPLDQQAYHPSHSPPTTAATSPMSQHRQSSVLQRNIRQAPRPCPDCGKNFIPSPKNDFARCTRCNKKFVRNTRGPPIYTLDPDSRGWSDAFDIVYPRVQPLGLPDDDWEQLGMQPLQEDMCIARFLTAINTVYDGELEPASLSSTASSSNNNTPNNTTTSSAGPSTRRSTAGATPTEQRLRTTHAASEKARWKAFYSRQQDFFNKKGFSNHSVSTRLRLLYHAILTYHTGGSSVYPVGGDNAGYQTRDTTSRFSERIALIEQVLGKNKRVVSDVVEGRGVCALVQDPLAYERRKTDNETSNRKKKGLHTLGKEVVKKRDELDDDGEWAEGGDEADDPPTEGRGMKRKAEED